MMARPWLTRQRWIAPQAAVELWPADNRCAMTIEEDPSGSASRLLLPSSALDAKSVGEDLQDRFGPPPLGCNGPNESQAHSSTGGQTGGGWSTPAEQDQHQAASTLFQDMVDGPVEDLDGQEASIHPAPPISCDGPASPCEALLIGPTTEVIAPAVDKSEPTPPASTGGLASVEVDSQRMPHRAPPPASPRSTSLNMATSAEPVLSSLVGGQLQSRPPLERLHPSGAQSPPSLKVRQGLLQTSPARAAYRSGH
jgi:hypothetical protein